MTGLLPPGFDPTCFHIEPTEKCGELAGVVLEVAEVVEVEFDAGECQAREAGGSKE